MASGFNPRSAVDDLRYPDVAWVSRHSRLVSVSQPWSSAAAHSSSVHSLIR
jgi:hypothetical protein